MQYAFIVQSLHPSGWRQSSLIHYRESDAREDARATVDSNSARAVRVLPVRIGSRAILTLEAVTQAEETANDE